MVAKVAFSEMSKLKICCLCGKKFRGWGNNPYPLEKTEKTCCDSCNVSKVIPARFKLHFNKEVKE
jgi:hypothetical protein